MIATQEAWEVYAAKELARVRPILDKLGYTLDEHQPHLIGERYLLMRTHDVGGGGDKLVLLGKDHKSGARVVIKATSDKEGVREIENERRARAAITAIKFSYSTFNAPRELLHQTENGVLITVTEFIEQSVPFLKRPTEEQFTLGLKALKIQEGVHATTPSHARAIQSVFGTQSIDEYLRCAHQFVGEGGSLEHEALEQLEHSARTIEQYSNFLTHADFVPHNLRIHENEIYLLDYASIRFGNKHESWARFLNFMTLYNTPLESAFVQYLRDNRTPEESESLRLMRIYKLLFLLHFYRTNLTSTSDNMRALTEARIMFWKDVLASILANKTIPLRTIQKYKEIRDSLRSDKEKQRQENLH